MKLCTEDSGPCGYRGRGCFGHRWPARGHSGDRYSADRKEKFETIPSPQATWNKIFLFHKSGRPEAYADALAIFRQLRDDENFRFNRLMFTKTLESAPLLG